MKNGYFADEIDLQRWLVDRARGEGWHADRLDGNPANGIPDLTMASGEAGEYWMEAKCPQQLFTVHDTLNLQHPLLARQREWLEKRDARIGPGKCGIIVAYRTGMKVDPIDYVAWMPIADWKVWKHKTLMAWSLRRETAFLRNLVSGSLSLLSLIRGDTRPR